MAAPGARLRHMDEQFSECLALMLGLKPTMYVRTGRSTSLVDDDPPKGGAQVGACRSCDGRLRGSERKRLFCTSCRTNSSVFYGPPLIDTMYRSAHPKYVLSPEKEAVVASIGRQREIARQENVLCKQLSYLAYMVYERWKAGKGDMNVYITMDFVHTSGSYAAAITASNPRYVDTENGHEQPEVARPRHLAVQVGGLGLELQQAVKQSAVEWLYHLDAVIRARFDIPLERRQGDTAIYDVVDRFASLIANRVVLLEEQVDDPTHHVCSLSFEHIIELQFVRCKHLAASVQCSDIRRMRELIKLARGEEAPTDLARLIAFLQAPCPELLKALPTVVDAMRFEYLRGVLSRRADTEFARKLNLWRDSIAVGSLCHFLERAIEATQAWKPSFLQCLRFDELPLKEHLPPQAWVDNARIASWSLVSSATHAHRRTGLDPTGLRIVLMSVALMQINGDGRFFVPGVVRCDIVSPTAHALEVRSMHAFHALDEQLRPYLTGYPWKYAQSKLANWQGSHIEEDMRRAAALLGGFSMEEICARYARKPAALELHLDMRQKTAGKMVYKPSERYDAWFAMSVDLLLPILAQLRQGMGISNHIVTNPLGDILRLVGSVRDWKPEDGALQITAGEAYNVPSVKTALLDLKGGGSTLVQYRRPKGKGYRWIFDTDQLVQVLGK
jgi:hypothetical protein